VSTEVLGIKSAPRDVKLLGKFFTCLASSTNNDQRDSVFIPKGAAYLLGLPTYKQIMQENNFFLTTVAMIPVNLEYDAWFAVIDPNQTSESDPVSLHDHLMWKSWFLQIKSVAKNKCLIITTKPNLSEACKWIDMNLEVMIWKSIPQGINPPSSSLPWCLDKPTHSVTSQTYADIFKKQFSLALMPTSNDATNNRPPCKRQAVILDYDLDCSTDLPATIVASNSMSLSGPSSTNPAKPCTTDYATKLLSLKQ